MLNVTVFHYNAKIWKALHLTYADVLDNRLSCLGILKQTYGTDDAFNLPLKSEKKILIL